MMLSVIIPAYNAQRYLEETLLSVLRQTGGRLEILVVDDGSTDATGCIAGAYAHRYGNVHWIRTENRGVSHARNLGIRAASGDYVAFLDADDVLCEGAYTCETERILTTGQYDMISFGYIQSDHLLKCGRLNPETAGTLGTEDPEFIRAASRKHFSSYLYKRSMLQNLNFFEGIRYSEDSVFLYRAARQASSLLKIDGYWFVYRNNIHSAMHRTNGWRYILTDQMTAWHRAGKLSGDSAVQWDCYGMVYSHMGQYLRLSAMDGVPLGQLQADMHQSVPFRDTMSRFGSFWTKQKTVALLDRFARAPRRTWLALRLKGLLPQMTRSLSRTAPLRRAYFLLKYRTNISGFVLPKPEAEVPALESMQEAAVAVSS